MSACKLQINEGEECIGWAEYSDNCSLVSTVAAAVTWIEHSLIMQTYAKHPTWWSPNTGPPTLLDTLQAGLQIFCIHHSNAIKMEARMFVGFIV